MCVHNSTVVYDSTKLLVILPIILQTVIVAQTSSMGGSGVERHAQDVTITSIYSEVKYFFKNIHCVRNTILLKYKLEMCENMLRLNSIRVTTIGVFQSSHYKR